MKICVSSALFINGTSVIAIKKRWNWDFFIERAYTNFISTLTVMDHVLRTIPTTALMALHTAREWDRERNWEQCVIIYYTELFTLHQDLKWNQTHCLLLCQSRSLYLSCSHSHVVWTCHYGWFRQSFCGIRNRTHWDYYTVHQGKVQKCLGKPLVPFPIPVPLPLQCEKIYSKPFLRSCSSSVWISQYSPMQSYLNFLTFSEHT